MDFILNMIYFILNMMYLWLSAMGEGMYRYGL